MNYTVGIAVDSHVQRVSSRLGWTKFQKCDDIKKDLEDWIPL